MAVPAVTLSAQTREVLVIRDVLSLPITGSPRADGNPGSLARVSTLREEPGATGRFFVNDILSKADRMIRVITASATAPLANGRE